MLILLQISILLLSNDLASAVDNSSKTKAILQAQMTSDYVVFGNFRRVCLIKGTSGSTEDASSMQGLTKMIFVLTEKQTSYISVLDPDDDLSSKESENHYTFSNYQVRHSQPSNVSYVHLHPNELFIQRFYTEADYQIFRMIFQDYGTKMTWLLLAEDNYLGLLSQMYLPLDSKVIVALLDLETGSATLSEVYQVAPHLQMKISTIGHWYRKSSKAASVIKRILRYRRRQLHYSSNIKVMRLRFGIINATTGDLVRERTNLTGLHLECSTIKPETYDVLHKPVDGSVNFQGFNGEVFSHLQSVTNFTATCHYSKDGKFGGLSQGHWNGIIREVKEGEADIGVATMSITYERSTAVDFLMGMHSVQYRVFIKRPTNSDYIWTIFTKQFSLYVWLLLLLLVVVIILSFYISARILHQCQFISVSEATLTILGFFLGQGTTNELTYITLRVIAFVSLFTHLLLLSHYTSDMVSALAAGPRLPTISNFEEIANDPELRLATLKGSAIAGHFRSAKDDSKRKIWQKWEASNFRDLVENFTEGIRGLRDGKHLLYLSVNGIFRVPPEMVCKIYVLPGLISWEPISFVVKKGSPLVPVMNKVLMDARSVGLMDEWTRTWLAGGQLNQDCTTLEFFAIKIQTVMVPLLILGSTIIVSLITLLLELYMNRPHMNHI